MPDRNASPSSFGNTFQRDVAIVLMLENIKELNSLKIEGLTEDIELFLNDNSVIFVQCKAVNKPSEDFNHVKENLKQALISLSEANKQINDVRALIYITNSTNPFNNQSSAVNFTNDNNQYRYSELNTIEQNIIKKSLNEIKEPLDTSKLYVRSIKYKCVEDEETQRGYIYKKIDEFLTNLHIRIGYDKRLHSRWYTKLDHNSNQKPNTKSNKTISKKELIWQIIILVIDIDVNPPPILEEFDTSTQEQIKSQYRSFIEDCSEKFDFITSVITKYNQFNVTTTGKEKEKMFIDQKYTDFIEEFSLSNMENEDKNNLTKVILSRILTQHTTIKNIKEGVGL